jgi:hypothetical protein
MGVRHDEGVATHIGPKPCDGTHEGAGKASAGDRENKIRRHFDTERFRFAPKGSTLHQ